MRRVAKRIQELESAVAQNTGIRYPGIAIPRCDGPVAWFLSSSYLNLLDFFSRGHLKPPVYDTTVTAVEDFMAGIVLASADITSTSNLLERAQQSFDRRFRLC
ncbi:hypothetical protein TNCV_3157091 [Trichonephila clavipes]|nr:hypothetical protein TNCV_3157091 [Trichonephila clavipes]